MLKVYAVCVNGVGSSLLLKMTVEKAFNGVQLLVLAICVFNIIRNIR